MSPIFLQIIRPHIIWLLKKRNMMGRKSSNILDFDRMGVNAAIILFSALFIEGALEDILCACAHIYTKEANGIGNKTPLKVTEIEKTRVLDDYEVQFENIFKIELNKIIGNSLNEDLKILFDFRHNLAHAQRENTGPIRFIRNKLTSTSPGYFSKISKYLIKRRVIKKHMQNHLETIFSDEVSDWFRNQAEEISKIILNFALEFGKNDTLVQFILRDRKVLFNLQRRSGKGIS